MPEDHLPADTVPRTATPDPASIGFGLMGRALGAAGSGTDTPPEVAFLQGAAVKLPPQASLSPLLTALRDHADSPLGRLGRALRLSPFELVATAICHAVESDPIAGRAVAWLQAPVGGARPSPGLLATTLAPLLGGRPGVAALTSGAALAGGALTLVGEGPLPERALHMHAGLAAALSGAPPAWPGLSRRPGPPDPRWPASLVAALAPVAAGLAGPTEGAPVLALRGAARADRDEVAARIGGALGRAPAVFDLAATRTEGLGALIAASAILPVFEAAPAPGESAILPDLPGYTGPVIACLGPEGALIAPGRSVIDWALPLPAPEERAALWSVSFDDPALCADLGRAHLQSAGRIAEIRRAAEAQARLSGQSRPGRDALRHAIWAGDGGLGALAQPVRDEIADDAMIASPGLRRDLGHLLARCRTRETLTRGLGGAIQARYRLGVRSLFVGPSGTGKTLAAAWLAGKMMLPLYRVDLASVSSKYIGETEKNLSQLLAKAEEQDLVLLFDEADSLFGKRTDISDSNDRFANAQTNYLLQRIESFTGIVLLTSNARNRFDEAFTRRIDAIIDFLQPEAEERLALWRAHLGPGHGLSGRDLGRLAAFADIAGGHIRNVVLMAAVLARDSAADRPIAYADVLEGLRAEYRKLGLTVPSELIAGAAT